MKAKRTLPALDPGRHVCYSPHVVLLGAGASLAALPEGDANGRRLPLMDDLVEVLDLGPLLDRHSVEWRGRNFEELYSHLLSDSRLSPLVRDLEEAIRGYFSKLQLPDSVTLYDELVLSLREKDLIATFNWDPFLVQAYARNSEVRRLPRILFLHGNVSVGVCQADRVKGHRGAACNQCGEPFEDVPLLYPVTEKNYQDNAFISAEWEEFKDYLRHAYLFTVFGYSAPASDVEAASLMQSVWNQNTSRELAQIDIVDIKPEDVIEETWSPYFVRNHYSVLESLDHSQLFTYPRRSCDAFAMATLQLRPCRERPLPRVQALPELRSWVKGLVAEEEALDQGGTPLPC